MGVFQVLFDSGSCFSCRARGARLPPSLVAVFVVFVYVNVIMRGPINLEKQRWVKCKCARPVMMG